MAHNGMLSNVFFRLKQERADLETLLNASPEGRQAVIEEATARRSTFAAPSGENTPIGTPALNGVSSSHNVTLPTTTMNMDANGQTGYDRVSSHAKRNSISQSSSSTSIATPGGLEPAAELRRRSILKSNRKSSGLPAPSSDLPQGTSLEPSHGSTPHAPQEPNVLSYSSNSEIALLARNIDAMEDELKSNGALGLVWPQNVTWRNYADYMFFPTLVYQLEYPRTTT